MWPSRIKPLPAVPTASPTYDLHSLRVAKLLNLMASPTGFEPVLPP